MKEKSKISKDSVFQSLTHLTLAALMVAISVVIGTFCKTAMNFGGGLFRITFENLPIILSGILFGPIAGGLVGLSTDIVSYLLSAQVLPINPIVTFGAFAVGFTAGLVSHYLVKKKGSVQIILSGLSAHVIGSMIIKTVGLFQFFGWAVLWRIPTYTGIAAVEITLLCLLLKSHSVQRITGYLPEKDGGDDRNPD